MEDRIYKAKYSIPSAKHYYVWLFSSRDRYLLFDEKQFKTYSIDCPTWEDFLKTNRPTIFIPKAFLTFENPRVREKVKEYLNER